MKRLLPLLLLTGCATSGNYDAYLKAQQEANRAASEAQKPLVEIVANEGQPITGLKSVRVFAPTAPAVVQQAAPNEWASVVNNLIGVGGTVLGIRYAGQAAVGLSNSIGGNNAAIAGQIQAPGAITTTTNTLSGTGTLGSGAYTTTDSTHIPTVVTQPTPTIVTQPAPVVVQIPAPTVVNPVVVNPVIVGP